MDHSCRKMASIPCQPVLLLGLTPWIGRLHARTVLKVDRRITQRRSHKWRTGLLGNRQSALHAPRKSPPWKVTHLLAPDPLVALISAWEIRGLNPKHCLRPWQAMERRVLRVWIRFISDGVSRLDLSHAYWGVVRWSSWLSSRNVSRVWKGVRSQVSKSSRRRKVRWRRRCLANRWVSLISMVRKESARHALRADVQRKTSLACESLHLASSSTDQQCLTGQKSWQMLSLHHHCWLRKKSAAIWAWSMKHVNRNRDHTHICQRSRSIAMASALPKRGTSTKVGSSRGIWRSSVGHP